MKKHYLAIDIGASSGRHILSHVQDGKIILEEVCRFDNKQVHQNGHDCWDMDNLWNGILDGLKACKTLGKIPATIGIDTWAVDYVLLDKEGRQIGDSVAYRDRRTEGMDDVVSDLIPPEFLYSRTGIQKQIFNTIYQLMAQRIQDRGQLDAADSLLMIPDYFHYRLTGVKKQEYTESAQLMARTGCIGHLRGDMGSSGQGFYTSWDDHQPSVSCSPTTPCAPSGSSWTSGI